MQPFLFILTALLASNIAVGAEDNAEALADPHTFVFEEIDQNRDGQLDPDEARQNESLTTHFRVWDSDQNGRLDPDEIRAGRDTTQTEAETTDRAREPADSNEAPNFTVVDVVKRDDLARLDADGDGYVMPAEWAESGVAMRFSELDTDGNGVLDETELAAAGRTQTAAATTAPRETGRRDFPTGEDDANAGPDTSRRMQMMSDNLRDDLHFSALDTDGNGMLDRLEATDNHYVQAHFDEWDTDNNDLLDPDEAEQARMDIDMN